MRLTPDGARYLAMARGEAQPMPFHLRWALPKVLGQDGLAWISASIVGVGACAVLTFVLALQHGASREVAACAALLWLGLPSTRFMLRAPVLVDAPGLALALAAAVLWPIDFRASLACAALGAAVSEKSPVWAALFAWQPWLLATLAVPLARRLIVDPGAISKADPLAATLQEPLSTGLAYHAGHWLDPRRMLLPWGMCLAALASVSPWWALPVAVAYGQLLLATDTVRLYQMAAPVVCIAAALAIPTEWMLPALVAHWFNPWAGDGV